MRKCYFLVTFLIIGVAYGQTPVITAIVDGDCSGGTPKLLEIYAKGTVDFSMFSLENQSNANTTWGNTTDLSSFGIVTNAFVYVTTSSSAMAFESEFPTAQASPVLVSGVINLNGDDRIRIIETMTSTVIDQYGVDNVDGTGALWEYKDSYARRLNGTLPDGTFTMSNWLIPGVSAFNGLGVCQAGAETFETIMGGIGNYDTVLSNSSFNALQAIIYPNPAKDFVFIKTKSNSVLQAEVYDVLGTQLVFQKLNDNRLDISNLSNGLYLLKIIQDNAVASKKIVIE